MKNIRRNSERVRTPKKKNNEQWKAINNDIINKPTLRKERNSSTH